MEDNKLKLNSDKLEMQLEESGDYQESDIHFVLNEIASPLKQRSELGGSSRFRMNSGYPNAINGMVCLPHL